VVEVLVGASYSTTRAMLQRLHQLVWSRGSMLGVESSSSFELVIHQAPSDSQYQSILGSTGSPDLNEALYEEVESVSSCAELEDEGEDEDEGIVMEGDAGFAWGDTRMERWKWEEEHGEGDYREEDDDVEDIFEFQYGDEEEDWG